jgi:DnaJ-domain-containing protein 1
MTTRRVKLKEKSPDFVEDRQSAKGAPKCCDMPGCRAEGEYRAPKDRGLNDYYTFCFEHVQEYNKAWDFFQGMSQTDIEQHIRNAMFGDRPTWIYTAAPGWEDTLRTRASAYRDFSDDQPKKEAKREETPEREALIIMGLEPPVTFDKIKERYRTLMKAHHPDRNPGDAEAEEIVKRVNMAYTILKAAHEKYETIVKV